VAYVDLYSRLSGILPGLSPTLARQFANDALKKIYAAKRWAFLVADAALVCPAALSAGSVSIAQYANTVTLNAAASAALTPFLTGTPLATQLQIRFMSIAGATTSGLYNILAVNTGSPTALVLTLDRVVMESTSPTAQYLIYRAYIIPPVSDFLTWISLVDQQNGFTITADKLTYTSAYFDTRDPQRQALGLSYFCGLYSSNQQTSGPTASPQSTLGPFQPIYELWPHSTQGQVFYCRYRRRGATFVNLTDEQPPGISDDLIVTMALHHFGYPYAQANIGAFPGFKSTNWTALYQESRISLYGDGKGRRGALQDAKLLDDDQALQSVWTRGHQGLKGRWPGGVPFPVDSNYIQSHPITW
jgi:hypothetical protein